MAKTLKVYKGDSLLGNNKLSKKSIKLDVYLPSNSLIDSVNLALALGRPLLLMGEPGCGKTRLAEAVAYEFHKEKMKEHYYRWDIKSTTKAKEGIYFYDALKRLYDANLHNEAKDAGNIDQYITEGELLKAHTQPQNSDYPNILLIDEIDKADIDFPNDLLSELSSKTFVIPEKDNKRIEGSSNVLVIVTSNQEKELPSAFLRRCIYHYIEFPSKETLTKIACAHYKKGDENQIMKAIKLFRELRDKFAGSNKKPSTSELIDWLKMIDWYSKTENIAFTSS